MKYVEMEIEKSGSGCSKYIWHFRHTYLAYVKYRITCRKKQVILYLTYVLKFHEFSPTFHRGSTMTFVG